MNKILAQKINKMVGVDQKFRRKFRIGKKWGAWDTTIDKKNTAELKKIVGEFGWPTKQLVGEKASYGAWLLAQHADEDLKFQKQVLRMMKNVERKETGSIATANIAYLTDRILLAEGKKQEFGTQFSASEKTDWKYQLRPTRALKTLDVRRKKYGLLSIAEYMKIMDKKAVPIKRKK